MRFESLVNFIAFNRQRPQRVFLPISDPPPPVKPKVGPSRFKAFCLFFVYFLSLFVSLFLSLLKDLFRTCFIFSRRFKDKSWASK